MNEGPSLDPAAIAAWEERAPKEATGVLAVDVDGFEGPLDVLLLMARNQKVDLLAISVVSLADQYLDYVERMRDARLELAADYLVMAAWLAYLKSRLLLPKREDDEPSAEEMAEALRQRLVRLEAMREAARRLMNGHRLYRDLFPRGAPEPLDIRVKSRLTTNLYDLLKAYAERRESTAEVRVTIDRRKVWSLEEARSVLERLVGRIEDWTRLDAFLLTHAVSPAERRGAVATAFAASLEMAREGTVELRQTSAFAPLYLRPGYEGGEAK